MALTKAGLLGKFSEGVVSNTLHVRDGANVVAQIIRTGLVDSDRGVLIMDLSKDRNERIVFLHAPGQEDPEIDSASHDLEDLIEAM